MRFAVAVACSIVVLPACAALRGQHPTKRPGEVSFSERVVEWPRAPVVGAVRSGGPAWSFFDAEATGVFTIDNGRGDALRLSIACSDGFAWDVGVAPHTAQDVLVVAPAGVVIDRGLCWVR